MAGVDDSIEAGIRGAVRFELLSCKAVLTRKSKLGKTLLRSCSRPSQSQVA